MGFKLPEAFAKKQQEIYDLKYILINEERVHVSELEDKSVTSEMKENMIMNSYAQDDLPPKLTDEALIKTAEYYIRNCSRPSYPCSTYDEALVHNILPELLKRLERNNKLLERINNELYTESITMNHQENSEFEKGKINGLCVANNIVRNLVSQENKGSQNDE